MENNDESVKKKNGESTEDSCANLCLFQWSKNITVIDLSKRNLNILDDSVKFPPQLSQLKLSHNQLCEVPLAVAHLQHLKVLDLSFNNIKYFDDTPAFCHTVEQLNISNNNLERPPYWVFLGLPNNLQKLDISNNRTINILLDEDNIKKLLKFNNVVTELYAYNCRLKENVILLQCFSNVKSLHLGTENFTNISANRLLEVPCPGLDKCCDIEELILCNTDIFSLMPNICMYKSLRKLDVSQNNINSLPNEFCDLSNLEICILSHNQLLYLPENMYKLVKLKVLHVDSNKLCMIFENLHKLPNLKSLDLYDNNLYDLPQLMDNLEKLDLALNYFEEPDDQEYLVRKLKLRANTVRQDGRKYEVFKTETESEHSTDTFDNEELTCNFYDEAPEPENRPPSSIEDWDSDDYWIPHRDKNVPPPISSWHYFIRQKMAEGNFCPVDLHPLCIADMVSYEKYCNPPIEHESDGQFDDYSDDDT